MRICRFAENRVGLVLGDEVVDVTSALDALPEYRYPLPTIDLLVANLTTLRPAFERIAATAPRHRVESVKLRSPVANPGKIVAAPVNYKKHLDEARADPQIHHQNQIAEIQRVGLFLKATSSLIGPADPVVIRHSDRRTDHEIELVAVIGKEASRVSRDSALDHVAAYAIGLDITVRGPEERSLRKSVDTYSVVGPWMVTADEITDPTALELELTVNDETRQKANTRDLVIDLADLIAYASSFYTLKPGDLVFTGTPEGVGPIVPDDTIKTSITGVGRMITHVRGDIPARPNITI
jgi:2,4-didehydro-3-deoxy-L-rhamnonate hydrolase